METRRQSLWKALKSTAWMTIPACLASPFLLLWIAHMGGIDPEWTWRFSWFSSIALGSYMMTAGTFVSYLTNRAHAKGNKKP